MMSPQHPTTTTAGDHDLHEPSSSAEPSLELEDLKHFDWGEDSVGERVFMGGADTAPPPTRQLATGPGDVDTWGPLPFRGFASQNAGAVFSGPNSYYLDGIRSWSSGWGSFGNSSEQQVVTETPPVEIVSPPLPMAEDDDLPPGRVRASSGSSLSEASDETMSDVDDETEVGSAGGDSRASSKGVSFNEQVRVLPIPPISSYSLDQRYRMYANRFELRENKVRNKKEYEFDGYNWRNATEEHSMAICPVSGELLHPAHL